jgi:hypothetical protein
MGQAMMGIKNFLIFGGLFQRRPHRNFLTDLKAEVDRNLERSYVVEQRQFITEPFDSQAWEEVRTFSSYHFSKELMEYAVTVQDFNQDLKGIKDFEEVYSSSLDMKTRDNAEILHAKKEVLREKFNAIRTKITAAQSSLRCMLDH